MPEREPCWIFVRLPGTCLGCGHDVQAGDSARYRFDDQAYIACEHCQQSPQRMPIQQPATVAAALAAVPSPVNEAPAASNNANLVQALEAFARRNAAPGADVTAVVDRMLAAVMRAVL